MTLETTLEIKIKAHIEALKNAESRTEFYNYVLSFSRSMQELKAENSDKMVHYLLIYRKLDVWKRMHDYKIYEGELG